LYSCTKKEQKDSKDKADTHRTAQPKAYGIMAGQIWWLRRVAQLPYHPSGLIPFPFGFPPVRLVKMAFFFCCFFLLETILRGRKTSTLSVGMYLSMYVFIYKAKYLWTE